MNLCSNKQGIASRRSAFHILSDHDKTGHYLKDLFSRRLENLSPQDRAFVRELCLGTVRWQRLLDYNIGKYAEGGIKDKKLNNILRLSAYQLLFMYGVPAYAAVSIGVDLAKEFCGKQKAGFANAVLKQMEARGVLRKKGTSPEAFSINQSHPLWLVKRWLRSLGKQRLAAALEAGNRAGRHWFRVNRARSTVQSVIEKLPGEVLSLPSDEFPYFSIENEMHEYLESDLFACGGITPQDPGAFHITSLAALEKGESLLDLCSAPGGKAALLSERTGGEAHIVCADLSASRLLRIRDVTGRLGHLSLSAVVMDGTAPAVRPVFHKVLVDTPCSNLGVISRRPEVKWRISSSDLRALARLQIRLINSASELVRPGGALVYSTCSPDREETADVIGAFLRECPEWQLDPAEKYVPRELVKEGFLWVYPGEQPFDGCFGARLIRK